MSETTATPAPAVPQTSGETIDLVALELSARRALSNLTGALERYISLLDLMRQQILQSQGTSHADIPPAPGGYDAAV